MSARKRAKRMRNHPKESRLKTKHQPNKNMWNKKEFKEDEESLKNAELKTKRLSSKINSKKKYRPNDLFHQ